MKEVVFLLEEESAKVMLEIVFRRLVPEPAGVIPRFLVFEGKQDLEKQLAPKIRGYLNPQARFIILRDQESGDCQHVKARLSSLCPATHQSRTKVRIACRELEAFYLGDLQAVEKALEVKALGARQRRARYRNPDAMESPAKELEKATSYRYQKVSGSRAIAPHLDLDEPRSRSFFHLLQAIREAIQ
jgi:hypothetical protein